MAKGRRMVLFLSNIVKTYAHFEYIDN